MLLAFVIAIPFAGWIMNKWLEDFAYRIEINWWMFAIAGIIVVLAASFTLSIQAIKAAFVKPVKHLRA